MGLGWTLNETMNSLATTSNKSREDTYHHITISTSKIEHIYFLYVVFIKLVLKYP